MLPTELFQRALNLQENKQLVLKNKSGRGRKSLKISRVTS